MGKFAGGGGGVSAKDPLLRFAGRGSRLRASPGKQRGRMGILVSSP